MQDPRPHPRRRRPSTRICIAARETLEDAAARDAAIDDAQYAEVQRRRKLIDEGKMKLIPWEEVEARIFGSDD
ncbi:MAG: addiction module protein [Nannocystis sp.]|nr:addiction module protein [Nannocystis sp.]